MPLSGFRIKSEYHLSEDSSSSASPEMVETTSPSNRNRADSICPNHKMSPQSQNFLSSKILISPQNMSYFEQRLQKTSLSEQIKSDNFNNAEKHLNGNTSSTSSSSLFTIDSILAKQTRYSESPSSSPTHENNIFIKNGTFQSSPHRSNRSMASTAAALFQHHPGLHITHLAASNFGSPEFLGKESCCKKKVFISGLVQRFTFVKGPD